MNLYHVQDDDRPMYVLAKNFAEAIESWRTFIRDENPDDYEDGSQESPQPNGVQLVVEEDELIV